MLFSELAKYYEKLEATSSRLGMIDIFAEALKSASVDEIDKIIYMTQGVLAPAFDGVEFGLAEKMAEEAIAIATGYTKEETDRDYKKSGDLGITAENLKSKSKLKPMLQKKYTVIEVYNTMKRISETSGSGSKDIKIRLLSELIASSAGIEARYLVRYPLGQLRLGLGDATILESLSIAKTGSRAEKETLERAYNLCSDLGYVGKELFEGGIGRVRNFRVAIFKPIRPALAERLPTAEEILKKMGGRCAVEQKYDGFRCQVHVHGKKVKIFSRRLEDTTQMFPDIAAAALKEVRSDDIIFEGEALAYNEATGEFLPFQETIQRKRKHEIGKKAIELPLHLIAFDLMYANGKSYMNDEYETRRKTLEKLLEGSTTIIPSNRIITDSPKEMEEFFESSVENGLEGIVAKDLKAPYIAGARKFSWIKMKRSYKGELSDTIDVAIVGYYLGRGSRASFKFGGLLCAVYNKKRDMFETISRLGSGFTEKQMSELEELLSKIKTSSKPARVDSLVKPDFWVYPKYVVTVRADEITKSPMHTCGREKQEDGAEAGYALRFPRLVGEDAIRSDKSVEEVNQTSEIIEMYKMQKKVRVEG